MAETPITMAEALVQLSDTLKLVKQNADRTPEVELTKILADITETMRVMSANSTATADAQMQLIHRQMPENQEHPQISAYSYPEGDLKRPKPALKCPVFWVGYPETVETLTPAEIDALNTLTPGTYRVTKQDGSRIPFTVEGKQTLDGSLEALLVQFPCMGDQRHNHRSKLDYCYEAMGTPLPNLNDMAGELVRLRAELAARSAKLPTPVLVNA